jgi:phage gp36-like protein
MIDDAIETGGRYSPPLTTPYPPSVVLINCKLAQYELISVDGYMPDDDDQKTIRQRYEDAQKWLEKIAEGAAIAGAEDVDQTPGVDDAAVVVDSDEERGWGFSKDPSTSSEACDADWS